MQFSIYDLCAPACTVCVCTCMHDLCVYLHVRSMCTCMHNLCVYLHARFVCVHKSYEACMICLYRLQLCMLKCICFMHDLCLCNRYVFNMDCRQIFSLRGVPISVCPCVYAVCVCMCVCVCVHVCVCVCVCVCVAFPF